MSLDILEFLILYFCFNFKLCALYLCDLRDLCALRISVISVLSVRLNKICAICEICVSYYEFLFEF